MRRYDTDWTTDAAIDALRSYTKFNAEGGHTNSDVLCAVQAAIETYGRITPYADDSATIACTRDEVLEAREFDFAKFVASRHSIRQFTSEPVDFALVEAAVSMAMSTPSVCNRQAWRVYAYTDAEAKTRILTQQTGNRGFGEQIAVLLVVACDLRCFFNASERNQAWVDAGMFAMSLVLALHSVGLGTCCLNWCISGKAGPAALASGGIPESDAVAMMIGVGHVPERFHVARSRRKPVKEALIVDCAELSQVGRSTAERNGDGHSVELDSVELTVE